MASSLAGSWFFIGCKCFQIQLCDSLELKKEVEQLSISAQKYELYCFPYLSRRKLMCWWSGKYKYP